MRKPAKPPDWSKEAGNDPKALLPFVKAMQSKEVAPLLKRANENYVHWHKFRYWDFPENVTALHAWGALKIQRGMQFRALPLAFFDLADNLKLWMPPRHQEWLHEIDRDVGGRMPTPQGNMPTDESYVFNSLMEEAIASSQLEGASTTREVAKMMLRTKRKPNSRPERMILNNYSTILELRDSAEQKLTPEFLRHIQELLTVNTLDNPDHVGRFRSADDDIAVVDTFTFDVMHEPPSASSLKHRIKEVCTFANAKSHPFVHPIIKACILHFAIGFIHPFADGNGRTARAIFYWYMLKKGYWPVQFLPISRILLQAPSKYARAYLYTETDDGDVTHFIHHHLQVILRAIRELHVHLRNKQKEYREAANILDSLPTLNHRQTSLLCYALKNPDNTFTIRHHQGLHHVSYATARADLLGLEDHSFLKSQKIGRAFVFHPVAGLNDSIRSLEKRSENSIQLT